VHLREGNVILSTRPKEAHSALRSHCHSAARCVRAALPDTTRVPQGSSQLSGLALSSSLGKYSDEYSLTARACAARPASAPKPVRPTLLPP
jgi:hypothetical protein